MGVNTTSPLAPLHLVRNAPSGGTFITQPLAIFEANDQSFIQVSTPNAAESGLLSGTTSALIRSGLVFGVDSSLLFRSGGNTTRLKLDKAGRLGLNTQSPAARFHLVRNSPSGGSFITQPMAIFEANDQSYLQLSNPNNAESGLLSGNAATIIRSGLVFGTDSSLLFRAGGNVTRAKLDKDGQMGINTANPAARLHVVRNAPSGGPHIAQPMVVFESNDQSYLQLSTPTSAATGIVAGSSTQAIRGGIVFSPDNGLEFQSGGSAVQMKLTAGGQLGINTSTPGADLEVNGTVIIGESGSPLLYINRVSLVFDLPAIAAGASYTHTFSQGPATPGASVIASPGGNLPDGLVIAYARVPTTGSIDVKFTNVSGGSINAPSMTMHLTVIH